MLILSLIRRKFHHSNRQHIILSTSSFAVFMSQSLERTLEEHKLSSRRKALELMRNEDGRHLPSYDKFFQAIQSTDKKDILWESSDSKATSKFPFCQFILTTICFIRLWNSHLRCMYCPRSTRTTIQ